jgi:uncharacterized glyoxalase superfamily protein PhnB
MLSYEDVEAAVDWLTNAFGFRERGERYADSGGRVTHAELELEGVVVMLGWPGPEYRSPNSHADECEQARAAGATILTEPADKPPGRLDKAGDLEGRRWMFMRAPR